MKVYQLMSILESVPAGSDVKVVVKGVMLGDVEDTDDDPAGGQFVLIGGDPDVVDDDGNDIGPLSAILSEVGVNED